MEDYFSIGKNKEGLFIWIVGIILQKNIEILQLN